MALAKSRAYQDAADAPATLKAYATDVANYTVWCDANALTTAELRKVSRVCGAGLAGARDRALFLLAFAGALRRSELVALDVAQVSWTNVGLKILIERSKTDERGEGAELVITRGRAEETCPVAALRSWLEQAQITAGPLFRKAGRGDHVGARRLSADAVRQVLLKRAAQADQPSWTSGGVRHDGLPQRGARRGNHGPHASQESRHHAQLCAAGKAQPGQPIGQIGLVNAGAGVRRGHRHSDP